MKTLMFVGLSAALALSVSLARPAHANGNHCGITTASVNWQCPTTTTTTSEVSTSTSQPNSTTTSTFPVSSTTSTPSSTTTTEPASTTTVPDETTTTELVTTTTALETTTTAPSTTTSEPSITTVPDNVHLIPPIEITNACDQDQTEAALAPCGELAHTGFPTIIAGGFGFALLALGGALLMVRQRWTR